MSSDRESKKPFALGAAIVATVAMLLWMANREPFRFGTLWGALLTLTATAAWVANAMRRSINSRLSWSSSSKIRDTCDPMNRDGLRFTGFV